MSESTLRITCALATSVLLMENVFTDINYLNGEIFLIICIILLTVSKCEQNYCCRVFVLHITLSPEASVISKPFIIKQSQENHSMMRFAVSPVGFLLLNITFANASIL